MKFAKKTIFDLLDAGQRCADAAEEGRSVQVSEQLARRALGYFNAAQALLAGFAELHNELIEHPKFIAARAFARRWPL